MEPHFKMQLPRTFFDWQLFAPDCVDTNLSFRSSSCNVRSRASAKVIIRGLIIHIWTTKMSNRCKIHDDSLRRHKLELPVELLRGTDGEREREGPAIKGRSVGLRPVVSLVIESKLSVTPERRGQNPHLTRRSRLVPEKSRASAPALFVDPLPKQHPPSPWVPPKGTRT
jgi:hypothetical protein